MDGMAVEMDAFHIRCWILIVWKFFFFFLEKGGFLCSNADVCSQEFFVACKIGMRLVMMSVSTYVLVDD